MLQTKSLHFRSTSTSSFRTDARFSVQCAFVHNRAFDLKGVTWPVEISLTVTRRVQRRAALPSGYSRTAHHRQAKCQGLAREEKMPKGHRAIHSSKVDELPLCTRGQLLTTRVGRKRSPCTQHPFTFICN